MPEPIVLSAPPKDSRSLLSAATYGIASAGQRALAFLLLPLYTTVLSPAEYGRISILLSIAGATAVLLAGGMDYSLNRRFFLLQDDPVGQRRFVRSLWRALAYASGAITVVAVGLVLGLMHDSVTLRRTDLALAIAGSALFVAATTVPLGVLRAQQRLREYLVLSAVSALAASALTVVFVVGLGMGVTGWFVAMIGANAVSLVAAMLIVPWGRLERFDGRGVRDALALGLPLVPHFLASWSLVLADRLVLSGLVTASALGVYSLGANFALPAMILVGALSQGFIPTYAHAGVEAGHGERLRETITLQATVVIVVGTVLALLAPPLAIMVSPAEYEGGAAMIPWITLGYTFLGLYGIPMNALSMIAGRTRVIWLFTLLGAGTNIGLIYLLVPWQGIMGAAIASAAGYFVLLAGVGSYAASVHIGLSVDWAQIVRVGVVAILTYTAAAVTTSSVGWESIALRCAWLLTLPITTGLGTRVGLAPALVPAALRRRLGH